jgi:D-serine deaminase-like pyridoxal phosphate-dependent protein
MFSEQIVKPTLVVSEEIVNRNIQRMKEKAEKSKAVFRPHFKTHQSHEIAALFRAKGIDKITVSSVDMANYFAKKGWNDITIAFVVNIRQVKAMDQLAGKVTLNLVTDSVFTTEVLALQTKNRMNVLVKIDTGYGRTGLLPDDEKIETIISVLEKSENLNFKGFLTHAGHTYKAKGMEETLAILSEAKDRLLSLKKKYQEHFPGIIISYGDTPSCSMAETCDGFDELRPGNFVFHDVMQYHLGSCGLEDIAVAAVCPVVSVFPEREELVVYGGAVHLSKENIEADNGFRLYGYVVDIQHGGWGMAVPGAYVASLSQEHGMIKMPRKYIDHYKPGDLIGILPVHSCLTADLLHQNTMLI